MLGRVRKIIGRIHGVRGLRFSVSMKNYFEELKASSWEANRAPLTPMSFLERAGIVYRDRVSVVYGSTQFTWLQTLQRCRRLASALSSLNVKAGDVVSNHTNLN